MIPQRASLTRAAWLMWWTLTAACGNPEETVDGALAALLAQGLITACPVAAPEDDRARGVCADRLTEFDLLRRSMREPFAWGGQGAAGNLDLSANKLTWFNPLVWRRMYLSLFMFPGSYRVEPAPDMTIVHLPVQFRSNLPTGAYPYPFWHSKSKWDSYIYSPEILLIIKNGKVTGAMRSNQQDHDRTYRELAWDGQWRWTDSEGQLMPYVSLYTFLLSASNPYTVKLDHSYRALEEGIRQQSCLFCHSPDNQASMNPLEILSYPNQSLYARHAIVSQLEQNTMPPPNTFGLPTGIADAAVRQPLLDLARGFAAVADQALAYEGEVGSLGADR